MTGVLRAGGTAVEVTGLRYEAIGSGQLGASYRFHLQLAPDHAGGGPATVVLKMGAGPPEVRELISVGYRSEVGFYQRFGEACAAVTDGFVERFHAEFSAEEADTLRRAIDALSRWGRYTGARHSLIHGDYRLDNLLFTGDHEVTAVDWQSLEIGFPARDLAYFLSTALPPEIRRAEETSLVEAYHGRLVENGVTGYSLDACFEDYRLGMLQGPLITVLGCMYAPTAPTESSDRMFVSMATRACAAIRDAGTLDLVA